jgi:hypothetical protein
MVQARVSCRSGVRPRGFVAGCIVDDADAASALAAGWGFPAVTGTVELQRGYDRTELTATRGGAPAAHVVGTDPDPLGAGDAQFTVTTTLAMTPRGLRLVQVEPEYELHRVERVRPHLVSFDGAAWRLPSVVPRHPVAATVAVGDVTVPSLRFVSRPDVNAFAGTEKL